MAIGDALRIPIRGAAFCFQSAIYKKDGSLITGLTGLSSAISRDHTAAIVGSAPIEIAGFGGVYADLTYDQMTADVIGVRISATNTDATDRMHWIRPHRLALTLLGTAQGGTAGSITLPTTAHVSDKAYSGLWIRTTGGTGVGQARQGYDYNGTSKILTVMPDWTVIPASNTTFEIGTPYSAFQTGNLATIDQITDAYYDEMPAGHTIPGSYGAINRRLGDLELKRNTAHNNFQFWMMSAADPNLGLEGLSVTCERLIDAGGWNPFTNTATSVGKGAYRINLSAADTNGIDILYLFTAPNAAPTRFKIITQL